MARAMVVVVVVVHGSSPRLKESGRRWKGRIPGKAANSNGWAWTIFMPTVLATSLSRTPFLARDSSFRFSSPPRVLPHLCTNLCAVRKYKRIAKFGIEVARTNLPSTASKHLDVGSTINLTENQLRNDFIDRANLP